jgi:exodeoxyribonuclease-5
LKLNFDVDKFDINNPPFDPKGRIKIGNYKIYIIDESSMINRGLVLFLEKYCKKNECKIIYVGDSHQLAPVGEKYSSAFKGLTLFSLTEIVRQGEDNPVSYLLDLLRYDITHRSYNFLNYISKIREKFSTDMTKGYQVCDKQTFANKVYTNFNDEQLTTNVDFAKVIGYTNVCVSAWNKFIRNSVVKGCDKSIITKNDLIISYTTIVNKFNEAVIKNSEEYIIHDIVNYVHPTYNIKGFMIKFQAIHGGNVTQPLFVVDHSDRFAIQMYVKISNELIDAAKNANASIKSQRWKDYYAFKESCLLLTNILSGDGKTVIFGRDLDYGFSLTSHKSQGSTFDTALVDVDDMVFDKNGYVYTDAEEVNRRLYVACSRCKNKLYLKYSR